jgi:hypothetical protein
LTSLGFLQSQRHILHYPLPEFACYNFLGAKGLVSAFFHTPISFSIIPPKDTFKKVSGFCFSHVNYCYNERKIKGWVGSLIDLDRDSGIHNMCNVE